MDYRKLIKFGDNSFVVSLPKHWLKRNQLEKGSLVYLSENPANELVLAPEKRELKETLTEISIDTKGKSVLELKREIIASYVNDYTVIKIVGPEVETYLEDLRNILNSLVAVEIIEQTANKIVAQDFLNIQDASLDRIIRRIDTIIRSIFLDLDLTAKNDTHKTILARDFDINKLSYLGFKVIKRALKRPQVAQELNLSPAHLLDYWLIILKLEKTGDALKRLSRTKSQLPQSKIRREEIISLFQTLQEAYLKLMKAYHNKDSKLAREIADDRRNGLISCVAFGEKHKDYHSNSFVENFKDVHEYIGDIARVLYMKGEIVT